MSGIGSMSSTFSTNTRVTLFFTEWTTTTPATYILTVFFLFFLGLLNRFLGALKTQLERRWKEQQSTHLHQEGLTLTEEDAGGVKRRLEDIHGHVRKWSQALRPLNLRLEDKDEESEPLSPTPLGRIPKGDSCATEDTVVQTNLSLPGGGRKGLWIPSAAWSFKRDGVRALLEFIRALIGYILMLAVMTYNVGFLFAVTGSVLLGEMVFGRYTQSGSGWQEGGCHE
ncbi:uncharacterized protein BDR25DRAFT_323444 [Lindgomyces ingoldianus]|uniref:Uncharacterized protein n=1 Tax=Lindgomyces ingoldianus TaxID=673940 RepID=A0ACB6R363_9PLEO|nr:uncharacterized protein BDR25DRAFT_323444 [Lindgomyces ingoldianus]KAF2473684.1 hypothetical protein BDR25DRAFT_323444 [Lindgomyces ingoldianus]